MPNRKQAIIWNNADPVHWRIYAALGGFELTVAKTRAHNCHNWALVVFFLFILGDAAQVYACKLLPQFNAIKSAADVTLRAYDCPINNGEVTLWNIYTVLQRIMTVCMTINTTTCHLYIMVVFALWLALDQAVYIMRCAHNVDVFCFDLSNYTDTWAVDQASITGNVKASRYPTLWGEYTWWQLTNSPTKGRLRGNNHHSGLIKLQSK